MSFTRRLIALITLALLAARLPAAGLDDALAQLDALRSRSAADCLKLDAAQLTAAASAFEQAAAASGSLEGLHQAGPLLARVEKVLAAKANIDRQLEELLALRSGFAGLEPAADQRVALRNFLRLASQWTDVDGRLRYLEFDVLNTAAAQLATDPAQREQFVDQLTRHRSSVGAAVMTEILFDPPPDSPAYGRPASPALRLKVLELIALSGQTEQLPRLIEFIARPGQPAALVIAAAETIRRVGLPQDIRPGQDPTLPKPAVTARRLQPLVAGLKLVANDPLVERRAVLLSWLDQRIKQGETGASYRLGLDEIQPGDWLLMRNPSPYNLFTDLAPGLFTHVGVVAAETLSDGIRRFVLVDLPERGDRMPATNLDTFVQRTRHYIFLRHADPEVGRAMGETAASLIGNETQFDMNFRTDRVTALHGQALKGKKINTYCAGLLLLCALESGRAREEFFPIAEFPAGGKAVANLAQLGITFGADFISPTGALFSPQLEIVGRREPTYDPRREVEEAIFDHFARQLVVRDLKASPDLFQSLRLKMAQAAAHNALLAQAMAKAAGVNPQTDLVSAAKAVAVVETLDAAAYGASAEFLKSLDAIRNGPVSRRDLPAAQFAQAQQLRSKHARLAELWQRGQISRRQLRIELVNYYVAQGRQQLDRRFFSGP